MKLKNLLIALFISCTFQFLTGQINETQLKQIDSLFLAWNTPNHPGGTVGVMKNGKVIFSKAYGLASLEYLVPNTQNTIYNIGSVSKQFTAMGIIKLQLEGKLNVDDDIRKYLPELPDFGATITIRHMLHHTSGLRSLHAMLGLAGWRSDDSRTNDDLNRFMLTQKDLNFKPGDEYLYCNTGFMLMVNIIEKVTGEKFVPWMKKEIFGPLGLHNTYVENKYNRIVANNATSYNRYKNGFEREVEYWGYVGSGNVHSTTADLLKWGRNFYNPQKGWEKAFKLLITTDNFNNGKLNPYAFGVNIDRFKGHNRVQHGGSIGGFRAFICEFPDDKLNIAVLTNYSTSNPKGKANAIANILLDNKDVQTPPLEKPNLVNLSLTELQSFVGSFWNDHDNVKVKTGIKDSHLTMTTRNGQSINLSPVSQNSFINEKDKTKRRYTFTQNRLTVSNKNSSQTFIRFNLPTSMKLNQYTGTYYSPEFETSYKIYIKNDTLYSHHPRHGDFKMKIIKANVLQGRYPFSIVKFKRDKRHRITGIRVTNGRARNVWFKKIKEF